MLGKADCFSSVATTSSDSKSANRLAVPPCLIISSTKIDNLAIMATGNGSSHLVPDLGLEKMLEGKHRIIVDIRS